MTAKKKFGFEVYDDKDSLMSHKIDKVCKLCKGKTLLDVGCGDGSFIDAVKNKFLYIVGLEPDKELFVECARRFIDEKVDIDILQMSAEDLSKLNKTFDCITALDVIEHLNDPLPVLKEIKKHLNPGGIFIMSTPNWIDFIWRMLGKAPQHKVQHTMHGWVELLKKAGFKIRFVDAARKYVSSCDFAWACLIIGAE
jgi:2-polyprenyl-3-methyl-5-hydroxy-6-metoxy-1,4-benzoquinol methylase